MRTLPQSGTQHFLRGSSTAYAGARPQQLRLAVRYWYGRSSQQTHLGPPAASGLLAETLIESVSAGAKIINVSVVLVNSTGIRSRHIEASLDHAANHGGLVIAAAGNRAMPEGTALTRHPWVMSVVACDRSGVPARYSDLSRSAACRGVRAPGEGIVSLAPGGTATTISGTSVATSLVTGSVRSSGPCTRALVQQWSGCDKLAAVRTGRLSGCPGGAG